jgi:hypothetical protein
MIGIDMGVIRLALVMMVGLTQLAAAEPYLTVDGDVAAANTYSESEFASLPRSTVTTTDSNGSGHVYEGVFMGLLLQRARVPLKKDLKGRDISKFVHVEGRDGFAAVFALPEFDDKDFLVADTLDGAPLEASNGPLQIISPAEPRRSRWVKQLNLIRIKRSQ